MGPRPFDFKEPFELPIEFQVPCCEIPQAGEAALDLERMRTVLNRRRLEVLSQVEDAPADLFANFCLPNFLYDPSGGMHHVTHPPRRSREPNGKLRRMCALGRDPIPREAVLLWYEDHQLICQAPIAWYLYRSDGGGAATTCGLFRELGTRHDFPGEADTSIAGGGHLAAAMPAHFDELGRLAALEAEPASFWQVR